MDDVLLENREAGERIQKNRIPPLYRDRCGVNNLYRYHHPEGHRSCYTLVYIDGVGVCPLILDILTHVEYERLFGYKM